MTTVSMTLPQLRRCECTLHFTVGAWRQHLTRQTAEVLALLLVGAPDRFMTMDTLIEALWPDPDVQPLTARKIIYVRLCQLRSLGIVIDHRCEKRGHREHFHNLGFGGWCIPLAGRHPGFPLFDQRLVA